MKQKLALCCALIHKPTVLFLDEPTTGVDPVSRKEFWEMLKRLKAEGITIVVSTPYMDEATRCDRIALIQGGKILSVDTPIHIIQSYPDSLHAIKADNMFMLLQKLNAFPQTIHSYAFGEYAHASFQPQTNGVEVVEFLREHGLENIEIMTTDPTIEDCFIKLLKK
jgi:ABC-type multidrug transport system ATPase subunit